MVMGLLFGSKVALISTFESFLYVLTVPAIASCQTFIFCGGQSIRVNVVWETMGLDINKEFMRLVTSFERLDTDSVR